MSGRSQFIGTAGQFYVAYSLNIRGYHAAITLGNVPSVDLICSSSNGKKSVSIQVKTSRNAHRKNRKGHEIREWDVGSNAIDNCHENFIYAFVDLREDKSKPTVVYNPVVFLTPSKWVGSFVRPDFSRKLFWLRSSLWDQCRENWGLFEKYFNDDPEIHTWLSTYPSTEFDYWKPKV